VAPNGVGVQVDVGGELGSADRATRRPEASRALQGTLSITTFNLTLAFAAWFLASALAPVLNSIGFDLTANQLCWLTAVPGLAGGTLRLAWMFLPPILGTPVSSR
jgi:NNP family nitrate/nitrite transporter-like MFS transporter